MGDLIEEIESRASSDGSVDYEAMRWGAETIQLVSSKILGLMMLIILIGFPIMIAVEIACIYIPLFQGLLEGEVSKVIGFVLRDAREAFRKANTVETGRNIGLVYLRIKLKKIIIVSIFDVIILSGGNIIIKGVSSLIYGIIKSIN